MLHGDLANKESAHLSPFRKIICRGSRLKFARYYLSICVNEGKYYLIRLLLSGVKARLNLNVNKMKQG